MRNIAITVLSMVLTAAVIGNAYYQKKQFYPSVVYITKSNPSLAIIYIQAFILVIIMGKLMRKIFFGELRAVEVEHLMERSWYAITETCLAFTVFRDDFNPKFLALFTLLLFLKAFHWLADERVDYMERSPVISWLFHIRIISLLIMLGILDVLFVCHAYQSTLTKGASVQLVFGFEYAILLTIVLNIVIKYAFHVNDFHELPWENKAVFLLYTELIMGFIKVILYFSFVIIMVRIYTLPLFAFRPMYYTVRAFKKAVNDVVMSRRAIRNMNTLYPDASAEELAAMDNVCIICREEMRSAAKKLPCNHIFHTSCLRSWFQRQQTCPTCRLNILRTPASNAGPQGAAGAAAPAGAGAAAGGGAVGAGIAGAAVPGQLRFNRDRPGPNNGATGAGPMQRFRNRTAQTTAAAAPLGLQPRFRDRTAQTNDATGTGGQASRFRDRTVQTNISWAPGPSDNVEAEPQQSTSGNSDGGVPPSTSTGMPMSSPPLFTIPENISLIPPYPFMAFNIPPPMPPPEGLSQEELQRLQQDTREGMEQRIRCLYTIQCMLDTSILMMQQYCAAAAVSTSNNYPSFQEEQPTNSQNVASGSSKHESHSEGEVEGETIGSHNFENTPESEDSTGSAFSSSCSREKWISEEVAATSNLREQENKECQSSSHQFVGGDTMLQSSTEGSSTSSEQDLLRQRRLEKFSKSN